MADPDTSVRQRKPRPATVEDVTEASEATEREVIKSKTIASPKQKLAKEDAYSPVIDIFRVLTFLVFASCGLSYLISSGESWTWGMKHPPKYLQKDWWESHFVRCSPCPPLNGLLLTLPPPARPPVPNPRATLSLRRHRSLQTPLPSHKRHDLRRVRQPAYLRPRRLVPFLRRLRCEPGLRDGLLRRRPDGRHAGGGRDVLAHR